MTTIDIKSSKGDTLLSTPIDVGAKGYLSLMQHDYIVLPLKLHDPLEIKIGSYVDLRGVFDDSLGGKLSKIYKVKDKQSPTYNTSNGAYEYNLRLDAWYWLWANKIFKYTPENAGQEAAWSLTATLDVHLGVYLRNLSAMGETFEGSGYTYSIDSTVAQKAISLTYSNTNMIDALSMMAEALDCEWWITENVINFGRCENGDPVKIEIGVEADTMSRNESKGTFANRIFAFGSTRNIPENYRPVTEQVVVNGVVQKRLMLPEGTPYIDAASGFSEDEVVENVVVFDSIYPRRIGTMSSVQTVDRLFEDETNGDEEEGGGTSTDDGNTETEEPGGEKQNTFKAYQYKDTGLEFKEEYILPNQELRIVFQSGKLNGLDFGVIFNPEDAKEGTPEEQLWEIVANEDYGRLLPDDVMYPADGDQFILYGFDIQLVSDQYIPEAEQELKEEAEKYVAKMSVDDGVYSTTLRPSYVKADLIHRTFDTGQRILLKNRAYFSEEGRVSRVIGWEMNLDYPYDHPIYSIGESPQYSRLGELEDQVDALTYQGQTFGGIGGGVYVIKTNDRTPASDSNVYSALRSLATFLRKDRTDVTNFLVRFLGGLEVGEAIDSMTAGSGIIAKPDGRMQVSRLEVRNSLSVQELIFNRLSAMESDYSFSESGTIDSVVQEADGTYTLTLRREWEGDFTALQSNDVIYGVVNDLAAGGGQYYTSWMRVLSVNTTANSISVNLYPDNEVPGGKNYPPEELMVVSHRGNPVDESRQRYWYISSNEGRIVMLDGVTKPILEQDNYSVIVGQLPDLPIFDNIPDAYKYSTIYVRNVYTEQVKQVKFPEKLPRMENNRGEWSLEVAQSDDPYLSSRHMDTGVMMVDAYDTVYHYGCKWECISDNTTDEPKYASTGWAMIEGNPEFTIDIDSSNGWLFDAALFNTTLSVVGKLYNQDVTDSILDADVSWTRDTGDVTEDNAWAVSHAEYGKVLPLTFEDLGPNYMSMVGCKFTATAILRDGQGEYEAAKAVYF